MSANIRKKAKNLPLSLFFSHLRNLRNLRTIPAFILHPLAFILFTSSFSHGQSVGELVASGASLRDASFPLYTSGPQKELSALVHVEKTYLDHERKLFFKIGAMPLEVLDGVTFEIYNSAPLTNGLDRIAKWLTPPRTKRLELRRVKLISGSSRLEAGRVRFLPDGKWELSDTTAYVSGTNVYRAPSGTFQSIGEQAGEVVLKSTPTVTNWFAGIQKKGL